MARHRRRHRALGALKAGCEIHVFTNPKTGKPMKGKGSRKKVCFKKKPSDKAVKKWTANLTAACASPNLPASLHKACGIGPAKKKAAKKKAK